MREASNILESLPPEAAAAVREISRGMKLEKCRKCGCMKDALDQAERAFASSEEPNIRSLVALISSYQANMRPLAYDCIGCRKCWGADATIALAEHFSEIEIDQCNDEGKRSCGYSNTAPALFDNLDYTRFGQLRLLVFRGVSLGASV
jgi:hypothetical protein